MGAIRVLLVDDSEDIRLLCRLVLESDPAFVVCGEAANGEEAIALVATGCSDAIILDIEMPVMDGLTALPLLRETDPALPVIVLTAAAEPKVRQEALNRGAYAVLDKDVVAYGQLTRTLLEACALVGGPLQM